MALARTPPDEAISTLSKWARWAGVHRVPAWLMDRTTDLTISRWATRTAIISFIVLAFGLVVYFLKPTPSPPAASVAAPTVSVSKELPPIPFSDDEVHGWLQPANFPTPPNGCDGYIGTDAIKILIGNNGIALDGYGKTIALKIGRCEALSIERSEKGVFIDAELNDGSGLSPVHIRKNEIFAQNGDTYSARQTRDLSSITVKDKLERIILDAKFLNSTTLQISGMFGCPGGKSIQVRAGQPIAGVMMNNNCFSNLLVGIHLE